MIQLDEVIQIGTVSRTHGKQGELQCVMLNDYWDEADATFLILSIDHILVPFRVLEWRTKGADSILFRLSGIENETDATKLMGTKAYMLRKDITDPTDASLTWQDLVGYCVTDSDQGELGVVTFVDESTANTLLTIKGEKDDILIPIHEDFIREIDTDRHILHLCLPFQL